MRMPWKRPAPVAETQIRMQWKRPSTFAATEWQ